MKKRKHTISIFNLAVLFALFCHISLSSFAQEPLRQNVRGRVVDKQTQQPIAGATIIIKNSDPLTGATSDMNGFFKIQNVRIGRLTIECTFLGYKTITLENIILSSAKELIINFELEPSSLNLNEVVVSSFVRKDQPVNRMAVISARSFTPEETNRYAGSYGDPARMAANYAGVMTGRDNRNDIVIRGNSSMGIVWKLDEIEIPNPNHYAALGTTGGPITILNSNLLTNSDFLTGAFPAEYGNALSGIFDLKMKTGNNEKWEHWLQTSWNGLEFGTEGPFSKKHKSSYIAAYRYSILEILNRLGLNLGIDPKYQDVNVKLNFPYHKGKFSIIALAGTSSINIFDTDKKQQDWLFENGGENIANKSSMQLIGCSHLHFFNAKTRLRSSVAISTSSVASTVDSFSIQHPLLFHKAGEQSAEMRSSFQFVLKKNLNKNNDIDIGGSWDFFNVSYHDSTFRHHVYIYDTNIDTTFSLIRGFGQYRFQFKKNVTLVAGLHVQYFTLNGSNATEPRLGCRWDIIEHHALNTGIGFHSQLQPRMTYFVQTYASADSIRLTNTHLDFSKSIHFVIGHDYLIHKNLRLKTDVYFQHLYDIPVKPGIGAYSILNSGVEYFVARQDSLVNAGSGKNYGVEITLEKFFSNRYFFLITGSLYNSVFKGSDNITRPTAFNSNYLLNFVGGYEKIIGKKKNGVLILGLRATWNGGRPYIPFNSAATVATGTEVLDWENAYTVRYKDYKRLSLRIGFRRNKLKTSSELTLDLQYRTNYTTIFIERIDVQTGKVYNYQKMGFYPMTSWKLNF